MILEFSVGNDILQRNRHPTVLNQDTNYYKCNFYPKKEVWQNNFLSATFMNNIGYIETVPLGEYNEMLTCLVPTRIALGGYFRFYISSNNNKKTNTISVALTNHYDKPEKKCNVVAELFAQINEKIDNIVYENFQLKCYSDGTLKDVIYLGNIDEDLVIDLVQTEIDTFKSTLADVAFTGSYNDLVDVPETFTPSPHHHNSKDIDDLEMVDDGNTDNLLSALINEINSN